MDFLEFSDTLLNHKVDLITSTVRSLFNAFIPQPMPEWERDLLSSAPVTLTNRHDKLVNYAMLDSEILGHLADGHKIQAIKVLRFRVTNCALKEAKDAVEDYRVTNLIDPPF